jgi:transcriptional antiterminator
VSSQARELEEHLTPAEIAERLKVSTRTVARWIDEGTASRGKRGLWPVRKLGRKCVRVPVSALNRFFDGAAT